MERIKTASVQYVDWMNRVLARRVWFGIGSVTLGIPHQ